MKRLTLALTLLTAPALAADAGQPAETVTVYGSSLAGIWHGGMLQYGYGNGFFSAPKFLGVADGFCRIAPRKSDLEMYCLQTEGPPATVTTDGTHIHFAWGTMMRGSVLDGEIVSAGHFHGHFQFRKWSIAYENPAVSDASRVTPDPAASDKAGKAALLRRILGEGLEGVLQDADAMKKNGSSLNLPKLGAIQAISYLGQETKLDLPPQESKPDVTDFPNRPDFFSVYYVAFADSVRLCGIHQRDDGVIDAFRCV